MAFEWTQSEADDAALRAICPFIHTVLGTGGGGGGAARRGEARRGEAPGRPKPFPVMIRLRDMLPAEFQQGRAFYEDKEAQRRWKRRVKVPALYTKGDMRGRTRIVCTAWVTHWFFEQLATNAALRAAVIRVTPDVPMNGEAMPPFESEAREAAR